MATFLYEAKNIQGEIVTGKMEGVDTSSVVTTLRQNNLYPVSIRLENNNILNSDIGQFEKISMRDIAIFCRQFSFTISSGMSILKALEVIKQQTENKRFKSILGDVFIDVERGKSLSDAMKEHKEMPDMLVNMIRVGEVSGNLDKVMLKMADYYDNEYKQQQKVKNALTYPIVLCIFAIAVVLLLVVKVLPTFTDMIEQTGGGKLPGPTRVVMSISNFIISKWWLILIIVLLLIYIPKFLRRNNLDFSKKIDSYKLKKPIFGKINKKIVSAQFARTFATLVSSGVSVIESMDICSNIIENSVIKNALIDSNEEIKKGESVAVSLEEKEVFPLMLTQMIKIGEDTGTLDNILEKTAEFYDSEVESAIAQLTTIIEPIIIVILAVVVGFIIASILLPMFQMYDNLSEAGLFIFKLIINN